MGVLVTPRIQMPVEMHLLQGRLIEESPKLTHQALIQPRIILVLGLVNKDKILSEHPRARSDMAKVMELCKDVGLVCLPCMTVNCC
jgi:Uma2 family endonuclease